MSEINFLINEVAALNNYVATSQTAIPHVQVEIEEEGTTTPTNTVTHFGGHIKD